MTTESENQITIETLLELHQESLSLEWIAGQNGKNRIISAEEFITDNSKKNSRRSKKNKTIKSLAGFVNLIHPHQIQLIGELELKYLEALRNITLQDTLTQLFESKPGCIIITDGSTVPTMLKRRSNENCIPLLKSPLNSNKVARHLNYHLSNLFADRITLHGVYMEIMAIGVLITGPSGIGKSELAMELISRGHRLIADDAPKFSRVAPDIIDGTCPETLQDFLEVRGLGIINIRELFGDSAIKQNKYLKLIVNLEPMGDRKLKDLDRLEGSYNTRNILDMAIPEITLPVAPGRNLAVMMECAARNHLLRLNGYNAAEHFSSRQQEFIENNGK